MSNDLVLKRKLKRGSRGNKVKLIQEWLCLHGLQLVIDGDFGYATDYAVRCFQELSQLRTTGVVDRKTFAVLVEPMQKVVEPINPVGKSFGELIVACAEQHLAQHPREVGGQNRGPWVRLYMKGNQGTAWPWCAGFVSFLIEQACDSLSSNPPFPTSFSCDLLAVNSMQVDLFARGTPSVRERLGPGSIFLSRRVTGDWVHTGVVVDSEPEVFHTIEGNTNDEGGREGYEVCARTRGYKKKDFILM